MPIDDKNGAPSTPEALDAAQDAALAANDFARYAEVENARDRSQALPEAPPPSKDISDKTPAPESGTEKPIQEKPKPKTGEDRKIELAAEIKELLRQRAELQGKTAANDSRGAKTADPPPAPVKADAKQEEPAAGEAPKKPKLDDFASYAEYDAANDRYVGDLVTFKAKELLAAHETERAAAETNKVLQKAWAEKVEAGKEEHADFAEVAFSAETPITPVMNDFILRSGVGPQILYKLGENASAEGKRIAALQPFEAMEALVGIKLSLGAPVKKETAPVKRYTAAPPPVTDLGGTTAEPADGAVAALAAKDFTGYMARENARELKAAR